MWVTFFFFNDTATTEIYTLSLHDALPISPHRSRSGIEAASRDRRSKDRRSSGGQRRSFEDRKSTRLNSSHMSISYAVFCLKKKTKKIRSKKRRGCLYRASDSSRSGGRDAG